MAVTVESIPAKKPTRRSAAAKKAPARKQTSAKAAPAAEKSKPEKKTPKREPPRITRKAPIVTKAPPPPPVEMDTASAVAFAMSIAQEMKRTAKTEEAKRTEGEIRLSRRPTTRAHGETTVKFPDSDLKDFRKRLLEARDAALAGVDAMKATGFNESEDHEADGGDGTNQTLRLQALGQMGNINRTIQQIEEALHRIDDGTYGVCTVCGQLIRKPRLLNQPFVLTCMECQCEMERNGIG
ncbi:MAG: TraR/DksA C4-type zinc finger protein [Kiritimatiellae bacterium]|nr:TraR/DksA C4-type zinc finger protein [Kiritimatiellia bacterium]